MIILEKPWKSLGKLGKKAWEESLGSKLGKKAWEESLGRSVVFVGTTEQEVQKTHIQFFPDSSLRKVCRLQKFKFLLF
jgi:hypothetical protein